MAPGHDDDLDWLYQRDKKPGSEPDPEPTRVLPAGDVPLGRSQQTPGQPPADRPGDGWAPVDPNSSRQQAGGSGGQPPRGAARPVKPKRPKRPARRVLAVIGILVLALVVWLIVVPIYAWSHVDRVAYEPSGDRPDNQPGTTYLLVGSDSRSGLTKAEKKKLGTGSSAGGRTDTMIILYVPPGGEPAMISLPRDSFVDIPGHGSNKLNAAYSFGGPKLLTKTVEQNTGLRVDDYIEVGFAGFVNVIDAIGGVEVCLKKPIKDKDSHLKLKAGCQNLEGKNALGYVRMRKADAEGDLGRVKRQRQMVSAMASKAASPVSVLNPVRYWKLANAGTDSLAVGENTSMFAMLRMGIAMGKVSGKDGLTLTVPIANPNASTSAGSSVLWDDKGAKDMFGQIARGDTSNLKKYRQ